MAGMKSVLGWLVLGACSAALLACGSSDERSTQTSKRPLGAGNIAMANSELEQAVKEMLNGDAQLKTADLAVSADVTNNQVTLSGTVPTEALRSKAVELAKGAHAGVLINDRIQVKPRASNPRKTAFA
ncbi:MAG TPA: BON domain-containing protein, partial [Candidatus Binatia bacterium]